MIVRQEEDRIPGKRVLAVLAGVLLVSAACVLAAWLIDDCRSQEIGPGPAATPLERMREIPEEINRMELLLFDDPPPAYVQMERQLQRLHGYGWVARDAGVIHIPIERAMELYLAGQRAPAGQQPAQPAQQPAQEKPR